MILAQLIRFSKRRNSTKQPDLSQSTAINGNILDNCNITSPSIRFKLSNDEVNVYNYAYIAVFNRYYFINEWTFERGFWIARMSVDVLASWKTNIGMSTQYVLRSTTKNNPYIIDTMYPTTTELYRDCISGTQLFSINDGCYVVGIISGGDNFWGKGVSYYVMDDSEFSALVSFLLNDTEWTGIDFATLTDMSEELLKTLFNPFQYIVSCYYFPVKIGASTPSPIVFGWWTTTLTAGQLVATNLRTDTASIAIPRHPQASERGKYLDSAPFSRFTFTYKPFGILPLDANVLARYDTLYYCIHVDYISGKGTLNISFSEDFNQELVYTSVEVGVPIQIAQISRDLTNIASLIGEGANALTDLLGGADGVIANAINGIGNALSATGSMVRTSGSNGGYSDFDEPNAPFLTSEFYKVVDEDLAHHGRPLCEDVVLSSLSGYVQCADAHVSIFGTEDEMSQIDDFLNSGFYYE